MEEIIKYIEDNNLKQKSRYRNIIYPRYYLYNKLREQGHTYAFIAELFNKDHCTILHGIKVHKDFTKLKDKIYFQMTEKERELFGDNQYIGTLRDEVLNCYDLQTLKLIKKRIKMDLY
jgi:hypothetical protein